MLGPKRRGRRKEMEMEKCHAQTDRIVRIGLQFWTQNLQFNSKEKNNSQNCISNNSLEWQWFAIPGNLRKHRNTKIQIQKQKYKNTKQLT